MASAVAAAAICAAVPVNVPTVLALTVPGTSVSKVVSVVAATDPVSVIVTAKSVSRSISCPALPGLVSKASMELMSDIEPVIVVTPVAVTD